MDKKLDEHGIGDGAPGLEPCTHSADPESARMEDEELACDDGVN